MFTLNNLVKPLVRQPNCRHNIVRIFEQRCHLSKLTRSGENVNKFTTRTHTCGQLTRQDIGQRVALQGWIKYVRVQNKFIVLYDKYGAVQCVVDKGLQKKLAKETGSLHNESVIEVYGTVRARPENQVKNDQLMGDIEVLVDQLGLVSAARPDMPILTREKGPEQTHQVQSKYRYLELRRQQYQQALRFRAEVSRYCREFLRDLDFIECETPTLFSRTPGGANEFVVPTQEHGLFYALTQSPQQPKQLLMIAGLDRYFQIGRCYRDETSRHDRQPEFSQLDIELSHTSQEDIMSMIDQLVINLFRKLSQATKSEHFAIFDEGHEGRFNRIERMTYQEAFEKYGTDKPDTRFGWTLENCNSGGIKFTIPQLVDQELVEQCLNKIQHKAAFEVAVKRDENAAKTTTTAATTTEISVSSRTPEARELMGRLRLMLASSLQQMGHAIYGASKFKFLWVVDFPLLVQKQGGSDGRLESSHHPFTAPTEATAPYLRTEPLQVIGQHYDLVLNGQEVGGGSIRIHDAELQRFILQDLLKLDMGPFEYFVEALRSGCPRHGGIALGLDRLIAILLERESIREVIAFPKSNTGRDLMSGCPHGVDADTLKMYHIRG